MSTKGLLIACGISGMLAVALGAFGAHGLKPYLSDYQREIFDKGIQYHFVHTLAALIAISLYQQITSIYLYYAVFAFLIGIVLFSGSLYLLATSILIGFPTAIAGPMTPIGGLFFIAGWILMAWAAFKNF